MRKLIVAFAVGTVLLINTSVAQAQGFGLPTDSVTQGVIGIIMTPGEQKVIEGPCLDSATAKKYRDTWPSNRDAHVRESLVPQVKDDSYDIVQASMVDGFTCWYIRATIKKH
jgi:hypothetical protein